MSVPPKTNSWRKPIARTALALALALTAAAPALAGAPQSLHRDAASEDQKASAEVQVEQGTLYIAYSGPVVPGMAKFLANEFAKYRDWTRRVLLILNSPGGSVEEGERVIDVLREIRVTHQLDTAVFQGATCASMCVPIFLQGRERYAAGSSLWVFHEASRVADGDDGKAVADDEETLRLFRSYYVKAGVRVAWLNEVLAKIANGHNLWQTGQELLAANAGIITQGLSNVTERPELKPAGVPAQAGRRTSVGR